jgi:hypothetical protein
MTHDRGRFSAGAATMLVAAQPGMLGDDQAHSAAVSGLSLQGELPHLDSTRGWLSQALKAHVLLGRLVRVKFWTYACISWQTSASLGPRVASTAGAPRTDSMLAILILVMGHGMRGNPVRFQMLIDGPPPAAAQGIDLDNQGSWHGHPAGDRPADLAGAPHR